jgi:hypothetical protein
MVYGDLNDKITKNDDESMALKQNQDYIFNANEIVVPTPGSLSTIGEV